MSENTTIEWCDATVNLVLGCTKVSAGCAGCPAERYDLRGLHGGVSHWGAGAPRHVFKGFRAECLRLNRKAQRLGRRLRVFPNILSDWLDMEWPVDVLAEFLDVMRVCTWLDFLPLTKRPENWWARMDAASLFIGGQLTGDRAKKELARWIHRWLTGYAPHNVCAGVSVENNAMADRRWIPFRNIPAFRKFVSYEPALGAVDWSGWRFVNWIISGGESGKGARPSHPDWHRATRDFCKDWGIAYFFKQWGEWLPLSQALSLSGQPPKSISKKNDAWLGSGERAFRVGKRAAGRLLDGREHNEFPSPITLT